MRRQAAQAPPPVRSKGAPRAARQASPRVLGAIAGVIVLVAVAAFLAVHFTSSSSSTKPPTTLPKHVSVSYAKTNGLPGAQQVYSMYKGIPEYKNLLGSPNAPVRLIEYIDLQCPYCDEFETQVMPSIVSQYVRPGKLQIEARPLAFIGPDSIRGRAAMIAAGLQSKAFDFAQILYDNQQTENTGWLSQGMVEQAALSIPGMNVQKLVTDQSSSYASSQAKTFDSEASTAGVHETPTLYLQKGNGTPKLVNITSPTDKATLVAAINAALGS